MAPGCVSDGPHANEERLRGEFVAPDQRSIPACPDQPSRDRDSEVLLLDRLKKRKTFSFKNRILVSTLLVLIGGVITIGVILQWAVFPSLRGDPAVVNYLKTIHLLASLFVIIVSWLFIERISRKITHPLRDLTERADQISREARARISSSEHAIGRQHSSAFADEGEAETEDEIGQLTTSINRMLFSLKESEERLRASEEKYRFLFDNNPSPIFVIDADSMMILDVNARAEEEYQYTRDELLRKSFSDLGLARDREQTKNKLKQVFPTEVTLLPVLQHQRKDGTPFMVSFQIRMTTYRDRPALIASVWDVTERLEKHAMLLQASKMATLGEMATGIAHELNQPLNVIRLGCDYLVKKSKTKPSLSTEDLSDVTKELCVNVERASRIITHLRQFGRRAEHTMSPIDINKPIRNTFSMIGTQLEKNAINWSLDLDEHLPRILGDENLLEQVFVNLAINARDSMLSKEKARDIGEKPRENSLKMKSFLDNGRVVVTISDTGHGIPESLRDRVFEPFFTTKKTGEGTGLGLSISYGIIKEHQGTIEIVETSEQGTTFRLTFPVLSTETTYDQDPRS